MSGYRRMGRAHRKVLAFYRRQDPTLRVVSGTADEQPPMRVARGQWLAARRARREACTPRGDVMSAVLDLCDRWDALSKGESPTTKAVREAYIADVGACGRRTVRTFAIPGGHGQVSASCVEPRGHGPHHRDADGNTWTESVR